MGRRPKPTRLKELAGNPGKRPLNENEPKYAPGADPPEWLSPGALEVWADLAPELTESGVLTAPDKYVFAAFCEAVADFRDASERVARDGATVQGETRNGTATTKAAPWAVQKRQSALLIVKLGAELGLSPVSRSKVTARKSDKVENPFAQFK